MASVRTSVGSLVVALSCACGSAGPRAIDVRAPAEAASFIAPRTDSGLPAAPDGGVPCGPGSAPVGPDCCAGSQRTSSAACVGGAWACPSGALCTCEGVPQSFTCVDVCGTDAFSAPTCANGAWVCPRPLFESTACAPGTCWGEPGACCGAPSCVDGGWVCGFRPAGC